MPVLEFIEISSLPDAMEFSLERVKKSFPWCRDWRILIAIVSPQLSAADIDISLSAEPLFKEGIVACTPCSTGWQEERNGAGQCTGASIGWNKRVSTRDAAGFGSSGQAPDNIRARVLQKLED